MENYIDGEHEEALDQKVEDEDVVQVDLQEHDDDLVSWRWRGW